MSCSINPLSWGNCVSDAVNWAGNLPNEAAAYLQSLVEAAVLWVYVQFLGAIDQIVIAIGTAVATVLDATISSVAIVAAAMGILAFPMMILFLVAVISGMILAFQLYEDIPVVG